MQASLVKKLLFIPALAAGIAIMLLLVKNRADPERLEYEETITAVRTIAVPSLTVVPIFSGNGNVEPSQVWNGIAQVAGKVIAVDPSFKRGAIVPAGQFLMQIDPTDYELAIAQVETNIEATEAQLAEIEIQEKNSSVSLKIELESLEISRAELARKQNLVSRGAVSSSEFEKEQRNVLAQRQSVQALDNTINLYPAERRRLRADLARLNAQLAGARHDLERTRITLPFTARISEAVVEQFQFVRQGDRLGTADGIAKAEIEVQVPLWRIAALIRSEGVSDISELRTNDIGKRLGLTARVYLQRDRLFAEWEGRVARFSDSLDPQTRTLGAIVEVDQPYAGVQPGVRPPLVKGFFVDVDLQGRPRPKTLVIPSSALHGEQLYVVDSENRLEFRSITTGIAGASYYSVTAGVEAGERIVVSDLIPAIEGMLLESVDDPETASRLADAAGARSADIP